MISNIIHYPHELTHYHVGWFQDTVPAAKDEMGGIAILSRFPLKNVRTFFTFSDQDEIGTAVAEFELGGKTVAFFNSHPSGSVPRKRHAEELVSQAASFEYAIAAGDYNIAPREEPHRAVLVLALLSPYYRRLFWS